MAPKKTTTLMTDDAMLLMLWLSMKQTEAVEMAMIAMIREVEEGQSALLNSHVKTVSHDAAYGMTWKTLKKMMTDSYTQRFQELALMCGIMFPKESDEVKKYVGGLPDMIQGSVMASKPKTMQDALEFATELIDQKIRTFADRPTLLGLVRRESTEDLYLYAQNETTITMDSVLPNVTTARKLAIWTMTGNYKKDCPKVKNQNCGNQDGNGSAQARAYAVGNVGKNLDANVVTGTFLLKNRYASIIFDTGADRSFMSTAFSFLIDIVPLTLDHDYDVKLADGKIIRVNTIIRGFTLNFLNHSFNIDLMPIELGSFNVIYGMDWLPKYHSVIVCDEKIIHIPFGNEILIFRVLAPLDLSKDTKPYIKLRSSRSVHWNQHVKAKDKSEEKLLEDVPIVRDFPEVFPKDLPGALLIGSVRDERIVGSTARTFRQRLSKTQFLTLGNSSHIKQEHEEHLKLILELLKREEFQGIHVDPAKIESIKDWASPKTPTEIR
ncbi:putative reverse transcriptase domain-containing protein [Tanacetum coccineum]